MTSDAMLISDIMALPPEKKAEIAEHVERLKGPVSKNGDEKPPRRRAGMYPGMFKLAPDFDDPLPGFEEYM